MIKYLKAENLKCKRTFTKKNNYTKSYHYPINCTSITFMV